MKSTNHALIVQLAVPADHRIRVTLPHVEYLAGAIVQHFKNIALPIRISQAEGTLDACQITLQHEGSATALDELRCVLKSLDLCNCVEIKTMKLELETQPVK